MNERELDALSKTVAYLWYDEEKDLEVRRLNGDDVPEDHIFRPLEVLDGYLEANKAPSERDETPTLPSLTFYRE